MTTHADGKWMQRAFKNAGQGRFHRQLGVPKGTKIPMTFLQAIVNTEIGRVAHNPAQTGNRSVAVTPLIKHRAIALLNADRANRR